MVVGGAVSGVALGASGAKHGHKSSDLSLLATTTTTTGSFKSNEDPAHEAGESAAREAQENSGQWPGPGGGPHGGAFKPNEDPAHEAGESAAREAQENAGRPPTGP